MSNAKGLVVQCVRPGCDAVYHVSRRSTPLKAFVCGQHSPDAVWKSAAVNKALREERKAARRARLLDQFTAAVQP